MWTSAVLAALLCAASQVVSTATAVPPANGSSPSQSLATLAAPTPAVATAPNHPGAAGAPEQDSGPVEDRPAMLSAIAKSSESAAAPVELTLPPITSNSAQVDGMPAQQDGSDSLADQVLDELVNLCERRLRSVTADAIRDLTSQMNELASNQQKIELALNSYMNRQGGIAQHLDNLVVEQMNRQDQHFDNLVVEHPDLGKSVDDLKKRLLSVETSLNNLQNDCIIKERTLKRIASEQVNISESIDNITISCTANEATLQTVLSEQDVLKKSADHIQSSLDGYVHQYLRDLSTGQQNLSTELTAVQARVMYLSSCQNSSQCNAAAATISNGTCGADGLCTCSVRFRPSNNSVTRCELHRLGDSCRSDSHCLMADAVCRDEVCSCRSGYRNINNQECRANAGKDEPCGDDGDCAEIGGTCRSGRCTCSEPTFERGRYKYRLINGASCKEGNVQISRANNYWKYLCTDGISEALARVVCRSMSFSGGQALPSVPRSPTSAAERRNSYTITHYNFRCSGSETNLWRCSNRLPSLRQQCPSPQRLGVRCD